MTDKHINDTDIQQYVLQKTNCDVDIIDHIQYCDSCKFKVEQYNQLFKGIEQQEKPFFDFSLADLVIEQLPKPQHKVSNEKSFFYFIFFIVIFSVCTVFYLFESSLLNLFGEIKPILIGLIIIIATSLLIFLCFDMYRKYQIQMKALNFY